MKKKPHEPAPQVAREWNQGHDSGFFTALKAVKQTSGRTWQGTKRHGAAIVVSTIISGAIGTLLPALQEHWQDVKQDAVVKSIYTRLGKVENDETRTETRLNDFLNPPGSVGVVTNQKSFEFHGFSVLTQKPDSATP